MLKTCLTMWRGDSGGSAIGHGVTNRCGRRHVSGDQRTLANGQAWISRSFVVCTSSRCRQRNMLLPSSPPNCPSRASRPPVQPTTANPPRRRVPAGRSLTGDDRGTNSNGALGTPETAMASFTLASTAASACLLLRVHGLRGQSQRLPARHDETEAACDCASHQR